MPIEDESKKRLQPLLILALVKKSHQSVFNSVQLSKLTGISQNAATKVMLGFINNGYAIKLRRGQISFSNISYVNATQMIQPSYVTSWTAFSYHRLTDQVAPATHCATTLKTLSLEDIGFEYHKIKPDLFYGFEKILNPDGTYFYMASKEKAMIDAAYLGHATKATLRSFEMRRVRKSDLRRVLDKYNGFGKKKISEVLGI